MKTIRSFIPLVAALLVGATTASHAQISILAGGGGTLTTGAQGSGLSGGIGFFRTGDGTQAGNQKTYDFTVLSGYDASTASKVVVTLSDEVGGGDTFPASITFGGTALTQAAFAENDIQKSVIYYLDASSVGGGVFGTGNLTLTGTGSNDFGVSWVFLSGTADGVSAVGESATTASVSLTTVAADSFVIATHVNNNGNTTVDADLTLIFNGESGSAGGGSGYTTVATAGLQTYDFTGTSRPATTAAAFAPGVIPETSSPTLTDFTYNASTGDSEVSIKGSANTAYKVVEADDLDFTTSDPVTLTGATVGNLSSNEVTTDESGNATVQFNLGTDKDSSFIRAETP